MAVGICCCGITTIILLMQNFLKMRISKNQLSVVLTKKKTKLNTVRNKLRAEQQLTAMLRAQLGMIHTLRPIVPGQKPYKIHPPITTLLPADLTFSESGERSSYYYCYDSIIYNVRSLIVTLSHQLLTSYQQLSFAVALLALFLYFHAEMGRYGYPTLNRNNVRVADGRMLLVGHSIRHGNTGFPWPHSSLCLKTRGHTEDEGLRVCVILASLLSIRAVHCPLCSSS